MESIEYSTRLPLSNRKFTILGVSITFQAVAILSVLLRLYIRFGLMKSPGWDDLLVTLAVATVTTGTVFVCLSTNWGLGQHFATLSTAQIEHYLFRFYVAQGTYNLSTMLIKLSLLFQYLRIFDTGAVRKLIFATIALISCWGIVYSFMAWFPCFPIRAFWDWSLTGASCYAYGTKKRAPFVATYESHAALNMAFDIIVFLLPMSIIWRTQRSRRENVAIAGLFALGTLVIVISSWRLATIVAHQAGWEPNLDFTYYAPISILLACLEVDLAVLAASIPIFWPIILRALEPILVTQEILITRERRSDVELESASMHSQTELNRQPSDAKVQRCKDTYTVERVIPLDEHPANRAMDVQGRWRERDAYFS